METQTLTQVQAAALAEYIKWNHSDNKKLFKAVVITDTGAWADETIGCFATEAEAIACIHQFADVTNITGIVNVRTATPPFCEYMLEED
jgi:hypothetical protein